MGAFGAGDHTVSITLSEPEGSEFHFDFLEMAAPSAELPVIDADQTLTLATDWTLTTRCAWRRSERRG